MKWLIHHLLILPPGWFLGCAGSERAGKCWCFQEWGEQAARRTPISSTKAITVCFTATSSTLQNDFLITDLTNICSPGFRPFIRSPSRTVRISPKVVPVPLTLNEPAAASLQTPQHLPFKPLCLPWERQTDVHRHPKGPWHGDTSILVTISAGKHFSLGTFQPSPTLIP